MPVFDLRGTHGSGKSHLVHTLLRRYGNRPILGEAASPRREVLGHYAHRLGLAVVGPYTKVCGGCDAVRTQDEVCRRVRLFSQEYPRVMLEGILVAHTYSRYLALARELGDYTFLFLDTPLEVCIARVKARRLDRGNTKPLDPRNVIRDHERVHNVLPGAFREAGLRVVTLDWQNATGQALEVIRNGSEG
jgi:hypothetical protein